MEIKVIANTDFIHNKLEMRKGEKGAIPVAGANDLIKAGLLRRDNGIEKASPKVKDKMMPKASNKGATTAYRAPEQSAPPSHATHLGDAHGGAVVESSGGSAPGPGVLELESADVCTDPASEQTDR